MFRNGEELDLMTRGGEAVLEKRYGTCVVQLPGKKS